MDAFPTVSKIFKTSQKQRHENDNIDTVLVIFFYWCLACYLAGCTVSNVIQQQLLAGTLFRLFCNICEEIQEKLQYLVLVSFILVSTLNIFQIVQTTSELHLEPLKAFSQKQIFRTVFSSRTFFFRKSSTKDVFVKKLHQTVFVKKLHERYFSES